jgi:hypothetical protein
MSKKSTGCMNEVKGPKTLSPKVIEDIVNSRNMLNARNTLAEKYGISVKRVANIWNEFYGGGTLKDYKSGLKKPLPTEHIKTADLTRKYRSERGVYTAREPKVIDEPSSKAKTVRRLAPMKRAKDLDLDNIVEMGDNEAQIMAGEVGAGNNNPELLSAIVGMIEHNQNISGKAVEALERALEMSRHKKGKYESIETDYESTDIDETDDSTAYAKRPPSSAKKHAAIYESPKGQNSRRRLTRVDEDNIQESYSNGEEYSDGGLQYSPPIHLSERSGQRVLGVSEGNKSIRKTSSGIGARAEPIYRSESEWDSSSAIAQQGDNYQATRHESQISSAKHNSREENLQQNTACNDIRQYSKPITSGGLYSPSGDRSCQAIQGVSWLQRRPQ